jgi:hypothetical protein
VAERSTSIAGWRNSVTYFELIELIEGQRGIINKQASAIIDLLNQCAEQENMINELMQEYIADDIQLSE